MQGGYSSRLAEHVVGVVADVRVTSLTRARPRTHSGRHINFPVSPLSLQSHPLATLLIPGSKHMSRPAHFTRYTTLDFWRRENGGGRGKHRRVFTTAE